jgi:hypothetical protein
MRAIFRSGSSTTSRDGRPACLPDIRRKPRFDHEHAAVRQLTRHRRDRGRETLEGSDIADGTEQTGDRIELAVEVECRHVGELERNVVEAIASDLDQPFVEVDTRDVGIPAPELLQMLAGAAGDIEQARRTRRTFLNQFVDAFGFRSVVLERVDRVVDARRVAEYARYVKSGASCRRAASSSIASFDGRDS